MLPDPSQTSTDSILGDDTEHINIQIVEVEKKRSQFLISILLLQGIWNFLMRFLTGSSVILGMTATPTYIATALMLFDSGIGKVKLQKIAKCLFYYTLLRSLFWILVFSFILCEMIGTVGGKQFVGEWIIGIIILFVECMTALCTLHVLRLTNQYFVLINRKMSRGVAEDDFKYNC